MNASIFVRETLLAVLPENVPPSFTAINSASYTGSGGNRRARAQLTMFDGQLAVVECWQAGACRAHRYLDLSGGDVSWEGDAWVRCDDVGNILAPIPLFTTSETAELSTAVTSQTLGGATK